MINKDNIEPIKTLKEYIESCGFFKEIEMFCEDDSAATTTTSGVALADKPMTFPIKREVAFGKPCFVVDESTYSNCMKGKVPFKRWASYIENEDDRNEVKNAYYKHKRILIKNEKTGGMAYLK